MELAAGVFGRLGIVRYHHHRLLVLAVEHLEQGQDLVRRGAVEIPGRLVADQERRVGHQGAGNRYPLLLTTGQLLGFVLGPVLETDQGERDLGVLAALGRREIGQQQR